MTKLGEQIGRFGVFSARSVLRLIIPPWRFSSATRSVWQITWRCLLPVAATVGPMGMVLSLQGLIIFDLFGAQRLLSSLVGVAVLRELSPVLASALVAAQGGSSFAAELGAMRIKEEIDATEVMAVDPLREHVAPRLLAAVIATPLLNLFGSFTGVVGSYSVAVWVKKESGPVFLQGLWDLSTPTDAYAGTLKSLIFGLMIGLISCYQGFTATGGAAGVGRAVNNAVVQSITGVIIVNYFLTSALFGFNS